LRVGLCRDRTPSSCRERRSGFRESRRPSGQRPIGRQTVRPWRSQSSRQWLRSWKHTLDAKLLRRDLGRRLLPRSQGLRNSDRTAHNSNPSGRRRSQGPAHSARDRPRGVDRWEAECYWAKDPASP